MKFWLLPNAEFSHALFYLNFTELIGIDESLLISNILLTSSPVWTKPGDYLVVRADFLKFLIGDDSMSASP